MILCLARQAEAFDLFFVCSRWHFPLFPCWLSFFFFFFFFGSPVFVLHDLSSYVQTAVFASVRRLAHFMATDLGIGRRSHVGLCSANRPEWLVADFAGALNDYVSIGIHTSWPADEVRLFCSCCCGLWVVSCEL